MGKGQRSKNNKAAAQLGNPAAFAEKNNGKNTGLKIALSAIALVVVAVLLLSVIQSSGILLRADYGYKSENFEIDGAMMQYLYNTQVHNFVSTYYQYIYYYGLMGMKIVDFSKPLESQTFNDTAKSMFGSYDGTWFDYFWDMAEASAKQILVLCEAAKAEGKFDAYEAEIKPTIDEMMDSYKETSKESFGSLNEYVEYLYGEGVKASDVRKIELLSQIATKYYSDKSVAFYDGLTDEQITKYHNDNKSDYLKADYFTATFSAKLPANATDAQKEEFLADVEEAKKHAEEIGKLESVEDIEKYLVEYWFGESFTTTFNDTFTKNKIATDKIPTGEKLEEIKAKIKEIVLEKALADEYNKDTDKVFFTNTDYPTINLTLDTITVTLITTIRTNLEKANVEKAAYGESSDREKWMFKDGRQAGDFGTFYGTSEKETNEFDATKDKEFYVSVYRMVKPAYVIETPSVEFGHILLTTNGEYKTEDKIKEKLIAVKDAFTKGEINKENFEKLAEGLTEDSEVFYDEVCPDDMVSEINDWIFSADRKAGDVEIIKSESYGYHLTYYIGQGREVWFVESKSDLHVETVDNWYKDLEKTYEGSIDTKDISGKISEAVSFGAYGV